MNREFPICARYGVLFTTGRWPVSDWNRPVRTRMPGGVGAGTGLLGQSPATRLDASLFVNENREISWTQDGDMLKFLDY